MSPGSSSKSARAAGAAGNAAKPPAVPPATKASKSGPSKAPNMTPKANANTHTTAELLPAALNTSVSNNVFCIGTGQPDGTEPQSRSPQQYRDGRIRNPVPSKLKGKTSASSGRFSVMHMDIRGKEVAADRDLAAKRTSENTAMAAQKAYESGYQPHRKSNWVKVTEEPVNPSVPFTGTTPYDHALYGIKSATHPPKEKQPAAFPPRRLLPDEVKTEQARLLTLLRSIEPITVVNQLCKALAYFGGIPDASPPKEGKFPESDEANGSGAVFVGWLAEIFPDLDSQGRRKARPFRAPPSLPTVQSTEKRGRGRPKGSKASKARSDKGIKKGSKKNPLTTALGASDAGPDSSWVDVDDSNLNDDDDDDDDNDDEDGDAAIDDAEATGSASQQSRAGGSQSRLKHGATGKFTLTPAPVSALFSIGKKKGGGGLGRPKGIPRKQPYKNRTAVTVTNFSAAATGASPAVAPEPHAATPQLARPTAPPQHGDEYSLAALQAFNESQVVDPHPPASSFHPVNGGAPVASAPPPTAAVPDPVAKAPAKKRKRNTKDEESTTQSVPGTTPAMPKPTGGMAQVAASGPRPVAGVAAPPAQSSSAPPAPPLPKRQRKSRAKPKTATVDTPVADPILRAGATQAAQRPANSAAAPPATQPSDSQFTTPTIEELEAQLEHDQSPPPVYTEFGAVQAQARAQAQTESQTPTQPALSQPRPPQPQARQFSSQAAPKPQQPQQLQQSQQATLNTEPQRAAARPRQQYQQQAAAQTASPNLGQVTLASPHLSVQSASPSIATPSPSLHQQRISNSQTPTSMNSQVQNQSSRNAQSYYPQQTNSTASLYGQQPNSHYAGPQPPKQQFAVPQNQQQQSYSPAQQQQPAQQPQYSQQKQQSYPSQSQQSYPSPHQQYSLQRMQQQQQQYATSSAEKTPQTLTATTSPQYGPTAPSGYQSSDGTFRANSDTGMGFNSSSYGSNQRSSNLFASASNSSYGNTAAPASTYTAAEASRANLPATTTAANHSSVQNVQSVPQALAYGNVSYFSPMSFENNIISGPENTSAGHNNLGASYNMGAGNVTRPPTNTFGLESGLRNDDNSYDVRR